MANRLSLWSDVECNGGAIEAAIPPLVRASQRLVLDQSSRLQIVAPRDSDWLNSVDARKVIRVEVDGGNVYEWRVAQMVDGRGEGDPTTVVECDPISVDLRDAGLITDITSGGVVTWNLGAAGGVATPADYIDNFVLPSLTQVGITYIAKGTIDSTEPIDLTWDRWTPLQLVSTLADRLGLEWRLRRNGSTDYRIDLLSEIGASANQVLVAENRNLLRIRRTRTRNNLISVIVPTAKQSTGSQQRAGIGFAAWRVAAVSGGDITLEDRNGGPGPAVFEDQLNGLFLLDPSGDLTEITDTVVDSATQTTVTAASASVSVGDDVEIRADSAGTLLTELESPSAVASYGRIVGTYEIDNYRGERNYTPNPVFSEWAANGVSGLLLVDGAQNGVTNIDVDGGIAGESFSTDDVVYIRRFGNWLVRTLTADETLDGTGAGTLTVSSSINVGDNDRVVVHRNPSKPTGWTLEGTGGSDALLYRRDAADIGQVSGTFDGAPGTNTEITLSGFSANEKFYPGDSLTGSNITRTIIAYSEADGSGNVTVLVSSSFILASPPVADTDTATVTRPTFSAKTFDYTADLCDVFVSDIDTYIQAPPITVRQVEGLSTLWASAGITVSSTASDRTLTKGASTNNTPEVILRDTSGGTDLSNVEGDTATIDANSEINYTLRTSHTMTSDETCAVRVRPVYTSNATGDVTTHLRWVSLTLGPADDVPPVHGSHATRLWQDGNIRLQARHQWPTQYDVSLRELWAHTDLDPAEPMLELGGTIRLVVSSMGIDATLRVVELNVDLLDPGNTTVILDTRLDGIALTTARQKPRSVFVDVDITTDSEGNAKQTVIANDTPATVEGTTRLVKQAGVFQIATVTSNDLVG